MGGMGHGVAYLDPIRRAHFNFMQRLKAAELHETLSQKSKKISKK